MYGRRRGLWMWQLRAELTNLRTGRLPDQLADVGLRTKYIRCKPEYGNSLMWRTTGGVLSTSSADSILRHFSYAAPFTKSLGFCGK